MAFTPAYNPLSTSNRERARAHAAMSYETCDICNKEVALDITDGGYAVCAYCRPSDWVQFRV